MRALVWDGQKLALDRDRPRPEPRSDRALVRVQLAGICSTDLQILRGYMGFTGVPGHELVGVVEAGPEELVGRRVVGEINFGCGACALCGRGLARHCPRREVLGILGADGCFADYVLVPPGNLHLVPPGVGDEEAVFAEPLAAAFEVLEQVHVRPGLEAVVLGDGKLGLLCAQVLHLAGARVTCVGKHPDKLARLAGSGIATRRPTDTRPGPADVVVEATGSRSGLEQAISLVRPRGTLVLKSTVADRHTLSLAPLVIHEVTVVGSRCGPFPPALDALLARRVSVAPLVSEVYSLDRALEAVEHAARPGVLKVLLRAS